MDIDDFDSEEQARRLLVPDEEILHIAATDDHDARLKRDAIVSRTEKQTPAEVEASVLGKVRGAAENVDWTGDGAKHTYLVHMVKTADPIADQLDQNDDR